MKHPVQECIEKYYIFFSGLNSNDAGTESCSWQIWKEIEINSE